MRNRQLPPSLFEWGHLVVVRRDAFYRLNLPRDAVVEEPRSVDLLRWDDPLQRRLDDFLWRRGNDVEREVVPVQLAQQARQQRQVLLQAHALPDLDQVFLAD